MNKTHTEITASSPATSAAGRTAANNMPAPANSAILTLDKAAIYCRVSTEEQRDRSTIDTQIEGNKQLCRTNGILIHDIYKDDGVSGTLPLEQRPHGARLLEDARKGLFNVLIIYKIDRLGRDVIVTLSALREIHSLGVKIISATETLDLDTPAGWAMAGVISAFGQLERENFLARSRASTERLAKDGVWLGGVVPFGYRVTGQAKTARLYVSEEQIPGLSFSEADAVRLIYHMLAKEKMSCRKIADHLNALQIPTVYTREQRDISLSEHVPSADLKENGFVRGKRKVRVQGIWRAGRILAIATNTTYKGIHRYGKKSKRQVIERKVPAIVDEQIWQEAQDALRGNQLLAMRNAKRNYLLRGLIKCEHCGLTYLGTCYNKVKGEVIYYTCPGKHKSRVQYGRLDHPCDGKAVQGVLEDYVWNDVLHFLNNPGEVLDELKQNLTPAPNSAAMMKQRIADLEKALDTKTQEQCQIVSLYRKGIIDDVMVASQLKDIQDETQNVEQELLALRKKSQSNLMQGAYISTADDLLSILRKRLAQPISWDLKRELIEILVREIRVETLQEKNEKMARVHVFYRFGAPQDEVFAGAINRTDRGYWRQ